jgi:hypothetical protein
LGRADIAAADPKIARFLAVPANQFSAMTGMNARDFVLAATGRLDPARLGLPGAVNIFR